MSLAVGAIKDLINFGLEVFGRYYSSYRAFVFDRDDPENMSRLRLIIPEVGGSNVFDYWAYPKNNYSGSGYGIQLLPQKGDMVWVEFEHGHPQVPIWSHGYRAKGEIPIGDDSLINKDCIWLKTPKGHLIKINDTENYIKIENQSGDYVEIDSEAISIQTKKKISLGSRHKSDEPALMGDSTKQLLETMKTFMDEFSIALGKDIAASVLAKTPFLMYTNLTPEAPKLLLLVAKMKIEIEKILSNKVTLDK